MESADFISVISATQKTCLLLKLIFIVSIKMIALSEHENKCMVAAVLINLIYYQEASVYIKGCKINGIFHFNGIRLEHLNVIWISHMITNFLDDVHFRTLLWNGKC